MIRNYIKVLSDCLRGRQSFLKVTRKSLYRRFSKLYLRITKQSSLQVKLPTGGRLWIAGEEMFMTIWIDGFETFEPDVQAALKHILRPGSVFVDCGANIGFYSITARNLMGREGRVVSIEANPRTIQLLNRNLAANELSPAVHAAITTGSGQLSFVCPRGGDLLGSLRRNDEFNGYEVDTFLVPGATLDAVLEQQGLDRVDVVKIDIEGAELDALRSARSLLSTQRPFIVVEYNEATWPQFGSSADALIEFCRDVSYGIFIFDPASSKFVIKEKASFGKFCNLVLIPIERVNAVQGQEETVSKND